jgi:hypothetical protein
MVAVFDCILAKQKLGWQEVEGVATELRPAARPLGLSASVLGSRGEAFHGENQGWTQAWIEEG